ncbi:MAG: hypothetical protein JWQ21_1886 [Herminiimonas sp.]|nr:hypothetical protein [Herminiimonas sp.]
MTSPSAKKLQRRHIEALVAVGDSNSVHRAAHGLGKPQPAVSRLLAEAEQLLGARLFERSSHGSKPTAQGEAVLARARFVLRSIERLNDVIAGAGQSIKLGCIPRAIHSLMPELLGRMFPDDAEGGVPRAAGAGFQFSVIEGSSSSLWEDLSKGALDFAILRRPSEATDVDDALTVERLYDDRIVIICAAENTALPDASFSVARLAAQRWVLPDLQTASRVAFDRFWGDQGLPPVRPVIEARSFESNLALVAGTRFISIAPESIARRYANFGVLRILKVRPALPASPVMLAFNPMVEQDVVLNGFRELVHATVRAARVKQHPRRR